MGIETLVEADQTREVWNKIQSCHLQAKVHPTSPTKEGLEHTSTLREDLYRRLPPEGAEILILVQPVRIAYRPPEGGGGCNVSGEAKNGTDGRTIRD